MNFTENEGNISQIEGNTDLQIANLVTVNGDFLFRKEADQILMAANNLTAQVSLGNLTGSLTNGKIGVVLESDGTYALQGSGTANLEAAGLIFTGDLAVEVNRTGKIIDETINIANDSVNVKFINPTDVSRFNASNLDLVLTDTVKDALLSGADQLIDLKQTLVPEFNDEGVAISSPLTVGLPGTDATLDSILGISNYLSLGESVKAYIDSATAPTLQGLIGSLRSNWLTTLPIDNGLDFVVDETGFSISYAAENHYQKAINLGLDANAVDFGIELDGQAQLNVGVDLGVDFDLSFDWQNFSSKFDLNKLAFNATAAANDIVLGAYFGPLAMNIGSNEVGKEKGTAAINLDGALSYANNELNVTTNNNRIDVMLPFYGSLGGYEFGNGVTPKVYLEGQLFDGSSLTFRTENFDKFLNFPNFGIADAIGLIQDTITFAKGQSSGIRSLPLSRDKLIEWFPYELKGSCTVSEERYGMVTYLSTRLIERPLGKLFKQEVRQFFKKY